MPIAFPVGSMSIPKAPATAPIPTKRVQNKRKRLAVLNLDFICICHTAFFFEATLKII